MLIVSVAALSLACGGKKPPASAGEPAVPVSVDDGPAAPAPSAPVGSVAERVDVAAGMLEKGTDAMVSEGVRLLEKMILEDPDYALGHFNLGVGYHKLGNFKAAERAYQNALAKDSSLGLAWVYLGTLEEDRGNSMGAVERYRQGLRASPDSPDLVIALVAALRAQGKLDEAITEGRNALGRMATELDLFNNLGLVYLDKKEFGLASFMYQKAMQIPGGDKNAFLACNLGLTSYLQGRKYAATAQLLRALELDPKLVPAQVYLARIYMEDRNYGDALPLLEQAAAQVPTDGALQQSLGVAYRGMGRMDDAKKAYQKALSLAPGNPEPHLNLGILFGDYLKDYPKAVAAFKAYIDAGGADKAIAEQYIADVEREQRSAERRTKAEEERKRREAERKEQQRLLKEAEAEAARAPVPAPAPPPGPAPTPSPEPAAPGSTPKVEQ